MWLQLAVIQRLGENPYKVTETGRAKALPFFYQPKVKVSQSQNRGSGSWQKLENRNARPPPLLPLPHNPFFYFASFSSLPAPFLPFPKFDFFQILCYNEINKKKKVTPHAQTLFP